MTKKNSVSFTPIGYIQSPYKTKYGAPRQPASAKEKSQGIITLNSGYNFEQALEDLQGFDYIWIIYWFHKNQNWKPKVLPPHGGRIKRGVFATRSPHRPNPLGLSLCKVLSITGRKINIENPDMLDGTPILDIKPYLPHAEAVPHAHSGWIQEENETSSSHYDVTYKPSVNRKISNCIAKDSETLNYVTDLLSRDPYPHIYRRIKKMNDGTYLLAVKKWRFFYSINGKIIEINDFVDECSE